jgi:hypothetical protein
MIQSALRWILLPLIVVGLIVAFRRNVSPTGLLLGTVLYYLLVSSFLHVELRYVLPMHALLNVWAGTALVYLATMLQIRFRKRQQI